MKCKKCGVFLGKNTHVCKSVWNKGTKGIMKPNKGSFIKGMIGTFTGKKHSKETKDKISKAKKGIALKNRGEIKVNLRNDKNGNWKGDKASYTAVHNWIRRHKGKATKCSINSLHEGPYQWANKSGNYIREYNDWYQACESCNLKDGTTMFKIFDKKGHRLTE